MVFAPPAAYPAFSILAGLKKAPSSNSLCEYVATGSRDKTINLWDSRGTLIKTLIGHDNWVKGLAFHPGGKYLLSCSDDKTIRCWDLTQEGRCVKVIDGAHSHFVTCLKWAPSPLRSSGVNGLVTNGSGAGGAESPRANGTPVKKKPETSEPLSIRCVIATGSVDQTVKIWAS